MSPAPFDTMTGGKKHRCSKKNRCSKASCKTCNKMGGMSLGGIIREALVPFGLYTLQKKTQRRRRSSKKQMKKGRKTRRR